MIGDSILNNIDERLLNKNGMVKVDCFSGSTVYDLKNVYKVPLLGKGPTKVIVQTGTNDASKGTSSADSILNTILDLKKRIEEQHSRQMFDWLRVSDKCLTKSVSSQLN